MTATLIHLATLRGRRQIAAFMRSTQRRRAAIASTLHALDGDISPYTDPGRAGQREEGLGFSAPPPAPNSAATPRPPLRRGGNSEGEGADHQLSPSLSFTAPIEVSWGLHECERA